MDFEGVFFAEGSATRYTQLFIVLRKHNPGLRSGHAITFKLFLGDSLYQSLECNCCFTLRRHHLPAWIVFESRLMSIPLCIIPCCPRCPEGLPFVGY